MSHYQKANNGTTKNMDKYRNLHYSKPHSGQLGFGTIKIPFTLSSMRVQTTSHNFTTIDESTDETDTY